MRNLRYRVTLQICNLLKLKSTNHAFTTLSTRNLEDERSEMVLRATTVSKKNFKEADFAKKKTKKTIEFVLRSNEQLLGRNTSD